MNFTSGFSHLQFTESTNFTSGFGHLQFTESMNFTSDFNHFGLNESLSKRNLSSPWVTHEVVKFVEKYYSLGLLVVGTIGNLLCLAVLSRQTFRRSSLGIYLRFLTLADLMALYTGVLYFTARSYSVNLRTVDELSCKFHRWLSFIACDLSSWALVLVSSARLISIAWPTKHVITRRRVYISLLATVVIILAANLPIFIIYGDVTDVAKNKTKHCVITSDSYTNFYNHVFSWIVLLKFNFLPFVLLIVLNTALVISVYRIGKAVRDIQSRSTTNSLMAATSVKLRFSQWKKHLKGSHHRPYAQEMSTAVSGVAKESEFREDSPVDNQVNMQIQRNKAYQGTLMNVLARLKVTDKSRRDEESKLGLQGFSTSDDLKTTQVKEEHAPSILCDQITTSGSLSVGKSRSVIAPAVNLNDVDCSMRINDKGGHISNDGPNSGDYKDSKVVIDGDGVSILEGRTLDTFSSSQKPTKRIQTIQNYVGLSPLQDNLQARTVTDPQKNLTVDPVAGSKTKISNFNLLDTDPHTSRLTSSVANLDNKVNGINISANRSNRNMDDLNVSANHSLDNIFKNNLFLDQQTTKEEKVKDCSPESEVHSPNLPIETFKDRRNFASDSLAQSETAANTNNQSCIQDKTSQYNDKQTVPSSLSSYSADRKAIQSPGKGRPGIDLSRTFEDTGVSERETKNQLIYSNQERKKSGSNNGMKSQMSSGKKEKAKVHKPVSTTISRSKSLTKTLLVLNTVFLVTTTPITIYMTGKTYIWPDTSKYNASLDITSTISNFCMYTNNAVNFILYCITGSKFRSELVLMFAELLHMVRRLCGLQSSLDTRVKVNNSRSE